MSLLVAALALAGCERQSSSLPQYRGNQHIRGSVVRVEAIDSYSALSLRLLIWFAGPDRPVPVTNGVNLYRIVYWSQSGGRPALVSGLLSLPKSGALRGTVLWMHGTTTERDLSVSNGTLSQSVPISGVFGGGGYLLLAPDLVGLGVSRDVQTYYCNPSTIDVTLDFLRAAQSVTKDLGRKWNSNLYLIGFSQGGHAVAVLDRAIESDATLPWHVRATAGISGPYYLSTISIPFALKGRSVEDTTYMSMWIMSYSHFYHLPLGSALAPRYAQIVPKLFDGDHSIADMKANLPSDPRLLFTPEFLASLETGGRNWFLNKVRENEPVGWAPKALYRAYYGENDADVPAADAEKFVSEERARGGNVEGIPLRPDNHEGTVLRAIPLARAWFDEISASRP